eukprot:sb/3463998/
MYSLLKQPVLKFTGRYNLIGGSLFTNPKNRQYFFPPRVSLNRSPTVLYKIEWARERERVRESGREREREREREGERERLVAENTGKCICPACFSKRVLQIVLHILKNYGKNDAQSIMGVLQSPVEFPTGFQLQPSKVPGYGMGVWTTEVIPSDTLLPFPYFQTAASSRDIHLWEVFGEAGALTGYVDTRSTWLGWVQFARNTTESTVEVLLDTTTGTLKFRAMQEKLAIRTIPVVSQPTAVVPPTSQSHTCEDCGKTFTQLGSLVVHQRIHERGTTTPLCLLNGASLPPDDKQYRCELKPCRVPHLCNSNPPYRYRFYYLSSCDIPLHSGRSARYSRTKPNKTPSFQTMLKVLKQYAGFKSSPLSAFSPRTTATMLKPEENLLSSDPDLAAPGLPVPDLSCLAAGAICFAQSGRSGGGGSGKPMSMSQNCKCNCKHRRPGNRTVGTATVYRFGISFICPSLLGFIASYIREVTSLQVYKFTKKIRHTMFIKTNISRSQLDASTYS